MCWVCPGCARHWLPDPKTKGATSVEVASGFYTVSPAGFFLSSICPLMSRKAADDGLILVANLRLLLT